MLERAANQVSSSGLLQDEGRRHIVRHLGAQQVALRTSHRKGGAQVGEAERGREEPLAVV